MATDIWKIESNPIKQFALATGLLVVGVVLMVQFRHFDPSGFTDTLSGFLLGVLLVGISVSGSFADLKQTIVVDPNTRRIIVESVDLRGRKERVIPFDSIAVVRVAFLGRASNVILQSHYVSLTLNDGSRYPLFFPAYFDGRGSEAVAEERCRRLEEYLQSHP